MTIELVVPATILTEIKTGLIAVGYAQEDTPLSFIQDAYFKYVMITQTGFNPNIPYAIGLLPQSIQDQLTENPEVPNDTSVHLKLPTTSEYNAIRAQLIAGDWVLGTPFDRLYALTPDESRVQVSVDSNGFNFTVIDRTILGTVDGNMVFIKAPNGANTLLSIVEIVNLSDAQLASIKAGTSSIVIDMNLNNSGWEAAPAEVLPHLLHKHPTTGKVYLIHGQLTVYTGPGTYAITGIDVDGAGTVETRKTVENTPRLVNP